MLSFSKKIAPRYLLVRENAGKINSHLNNNILGISTIKSFTSEEHELKKIEFLSNEYKKSNKNAIKLSSAITPVIRMAIMLGFIIILVFGGLKVLNNELGVAVYSILIFLSQRLLWPLTSLAEVTDMYQRSLASADRVMNLLNTPIKIPYSGDSLDLNLIKGEIEFKSVNFGYSSVETVKNLSFKVKAGQTIAFVGTTGSGKSTILKLLLRFYEKNQE